MPKVIPRLIHIVMIKRNRILVGCSHVMRVYYNGKSIDTVTRCGVCTFTLFIVNCLQISRIFIFCYISIALTSHHRRNLNEINSGPLSHLILTGLP